MRVSAHKCHAFLLGINKKQEDTVIENLHLHKQLLSEQTSTLTPSSTVSETKGDV